MQHDRFIEWLYLSVFDELGEDEGRRLDEHLRSCADCSQEREKIVRMLDSITASGVAEPSQEMLASARQSLRAALWKESLTQAAMRRPSGGESFLGRLLGSARGYGLGLAGAAAVCIGFFLGYIAFRGAPAVSPLPQQEPTVNGLYAGISNVRFLDTGAIDGEVDITYDQFRPVRLRAPVDDPRVQDVLAYALLNDENPGVRLRAIRAFESEPSGAPPEEMKQAFLTAFNSDPNAGVRLQALLVLRRLPFDEDIKNMLLFALSHDANPGIRIAVMNYLAEITLEGIMPEEEMYDIMSTRAAADQSESASRRANDT